jgi:hypothetical protein
LGDKRMAAARKNKEPKKADHEETKWTEFG